MRHTGWCSARTVFMSLPAPSTAVLLSCYVRYQQLIPILGT